MKRLMISVLCAVICLILGDIDASGAAKAKGNKSTIKDQGDMQCCELTLIGVVSEEKVKESKQENKKPRKYRVFTDTKNKEWPLPREKKVDGEINLKEYEGVKVKMVCMVLGEKITGIKSIDKLAK